MKRFLKIFVFVVLPILFIGGIIFEGLLLMYVFTPSYYVKTAINEEGQGIYIKDTGDPADNKDNFVNWFDKQVEAALKLDSDTIHIDEDYELEGDFSLCTFNNPNSPDTKYLYEKEMIITPKSNVFSGDPIKFWFIVNDKLAFGGFAPDPSVPDEDKENAPSDWINGIGTFDNKISIANINSDEELDNLFLANFTNNLVGFTQSEVYKVIWSYNGRTTSNPQASEPIRWDDKSEIFVDASDSQGNDWYYMYIDGSVSTSWYNAQDFNYGVTNHIFFKP